MPDIEQDLFDMLFEDDVRDHRILKPPYPWPGNKYRSVKQILDLLPDSEIYAEPFGGSAAVMLSKKQSKTEVYNDRFTGVVDFYKCLRDPVLRIELTSILSIMEYSRETFMECKRTWESQTGLVSRAARWYYSVCTSFSGLGRNFGRITGTGGSAQLTQRIARNIKLFPKIAERFANVQIENCSYQSIMVDFDSHGTVFYLDPPYLDTDQGVYSYKWTEEDQIEMLDLAFCCDGLVAVSGYDHKITNGYPWDSVHEWDISASMDSVTKENKAHKSKKNIATEKLWIKEAD